MTETTPSLSHKSILITGCSSGIGLSAAQILHKKGYHVFATARKAEDVTRLRELGLESQQLDLDDSSSISSAVDWALERTGGTLAALFNNGAYGQPGAVEDLSRDALRAQFETNLFGTQELTNLVIPVMRRQGYGRIVYNSSLLGFVALSYRGAYNASKFALEGLADTLRLELHSSNIYVSLIEPGPIATRFRANSYEKYLEHIDGENSIHKEAYQSMANRLAKQGAAVPFTLPSEAVVDKLLHALESRRPKARYHVTLPTTLFATLKRILPQRLLDRILLKVSGS